jgi:glycosyltransferase involved in cell wall biosynthesis
LKSHWCIIVDRFYPESAGVGNSTYSLATAMVHHGFTVSVLTPRSCKNHPSFETINGINIYRIGQRSLEKYGVLVYLFYIYFLFYGLILLHFRLRPDYVLGQTAWEGGILSGIWGLLCRKRVSLVHTHGGVVYANKYLLLAKIAYTINKIVLVTNNDYAAQVKAIAPRSKPQIARNIYIPEKLHSSRDQLRHHQNMDDGRFHVVCVGRMVYERGVETKGFSHAIKAIAGIDGIVIHFLGDGPNRVELERLGKQLHSNALFHGMVSKQEIAVYMHSADCLLQSSINEGVSMSMVEAMAYRLPVISTRTSGAIDIIKDRKNGLLIIPGDDRSIHDAIITLMEDPQLRYSLAEEGYQTFLQEFTETTVLQQYINAVKVFK